MGNAFSATQEDTAHEIRRIISKLRPISPSKVSTASIVCTLMDRLFWRAERRGTRFLERMCFGPAPTRWLGIPTW